MGHVQLCGSTQTCSFDNYVKRLETPQSALHGIFLSSNNFLCRTKKKMISCSIMPQIVFDFLAPVALT